jgi:genome maintenance exonuclease 1
MYLPNKFTYVAINRETIDGQRRYATPDGEKLPSVTTILDATKPEEKKKALQEWRNRVGHQKAQQITTEAAGRGTRMHKWLENYIRNGETGEPGSNPYSIQSHLMANSIITNGLSKCTEFWGTEVPLYFPKIYAGTTDLVGIHGSAEAIMDHKQTNKPKKREWIEDYFIQLAAYAAAHNEVYGTNIRKGVIFMCSADNQYQEFIIEGEEFDRWTDKWFKRLEEYYSQFVY